MINKRKWYGLLQNGKLVMVADHDKPPTVDGFQDDVPICTDGSKWEVVSLSVTQKGTKSYNIIDGINHPHFLILPKDTVLELIEGQYSGDDYSLEYLDLYLDKKGRTAEEAHAQLPEHKQMLPLEDRNYAFVVKNKIGDLYICFDAIVERVSSKAGLLEFLEDKVSFERCEQGPMKGYYECL